MKTAPLAGARNAQIAGNCPGWWGNQAGFAGFCAPPAVHPLEVAIYMAEPLAVQGSCPAKTTQRSMLKPENNSKTTNAMPAHENGEITVRVVHEDGKQEPRVRLQASPEEIAANPPRTKQEHKRLVKLIDAYYYLHSITEIPSELLGMTCGAKTRRGTGCKQKAIYRNGRCKLHGGLSTGRKKPSP